MRKRDNNCGEILSDIEMLDIGDLSIIANKDLINLQKENPDLLVFPQILGQYHDDIEKSVVFSLEEKKLTTYNLMGFIGRNSNQLTIASRFAKDDNSDYFLHYMLQRVFAINLFNFDLTSNNENIWDFLIYIFPYYLKKAFTQGIYKAYIRVDYNDTNIKGSIDVGRHINKNIPFMGKVAYSTREHSYDNNITQLIRHTIEHIKAQTVGIGVLTNDSEVRDIVNKFNYITDKSYNKNDRQKIISSNLKPVNHPYFTEYSVLQKICLKILRREKITFGNEKDKVYGLLFDGAWLWEEYLNTILKDNFIHPENKTGKYKEYLFDNNIQPIYPDFISKSEPKLVGDAKYIPLDKQESYSDNSEKAISIYYKTITYMYRFRSIHGFLLFPKQDSNYYKELKINGTDGVIKKIGLAIPSKAESFKEFNNTMVYNEEIIKQLII